MAVVYIITNTEGSDEFAIQPQTLNGPGGIQQNTDLRLPGNGLAIWGEAYNENVYRLLESFALPEKAGSPGVPQDAGDLGTGNGINTPLEGQLWWNKTQSKLFVFGGTSWNEPNVVGVGGTADVPASCTAGDLFFDTDEEQLLVCDGSGFISVADSYVLKAGDTMDAAANLTFSGGEVLGLPATPSATGASSKEYVDGKFVELAGDTMVGSLEMGTNVINLTNLPTLGTNAANKNYVDNEIGTAFPLPETGDVRMSTDATNPLYPNWLPCDGSTMGDVGSGAAHQSVSNEDLFNILKLSFGNVGTEVFGSANPALNKVFLPDFNGRSPMGSGTSDAPTTTSNTNRGHGTKGGTEEHVMTIPEMPSHTHLEIRVGPTQFNHDTGSHFRDTDNSNTQTGPAGGDQPHNNTHPFLALNFLVAI